MERTLKRKLRKEDFKLRQEQKELRDYLLHKKSKPDIVKPEDIVNLIDYPDSPYMYVKGSNLWQGLKDSWLGYKIGKRKGGLGDVIEQKRQRECAVKVQEIQGLLRLDIDDFSHIGISKPGHLHPEGYKTYNNDEFLGEDII